MSGNTNLDIIREAAQGDNAMVLGFEHCDSATVAAAFRLQPN